MVLARDLCHSMSAQSVVGMCHVLLSSEKLPSLLSVCIRQLVHSLLELVLFEEVYIVI